MTEIEPTIENVKLGDVVVLESGTPNSPGWIATAHKVSDRGGFCVVTIETLACNLNDGKRITRITRPAPPVPSTPGERFWASVIRGHDPMEFIVTDSGTAINLKHGMTHNLDGFPYTVVPAPEPETVPVPADLIREAVEWQTELSDAAGRASWVILSDIVQAVREARKEEP